MNSIMEFKWPKDEDSTEYVSLGFETSEFDIVLGACRDRLVYAASTPYLQLDRTDAEFYGVLLQYNNDLKIKPIPLSKSQLHFLQTALREHMEVAETESMDDAQKSVQLAHEIDIELAVRAFSDDIPSCVPQNYTGEV